MPNQYNSTNYLTGFIKKYKLIIIILILIPVVLSIACYFSVPFFNEAGSSAWLGFWGGYIGSTIMAGVTLYVLHAQLEQNHLENQENRNVQNKLMLYQIGYDNLKSFKEASNLFCKTLNYNSLVEIVNIFILESQSPIKQIKQEFANTTEVERLSNFYIIAEPSTYFLELIKEQDKVLGYYNEILMDFEVVVSYLNLTTSYIKNNILTDKHSSSSLKDIISQHYPSLDNQDPKKWLDTVLVKRLEIVNPKFLERTWELISNVHLEELKRLKSLLKDNGTEQDK